MKTEDNLLKNLYQRYISTIIPNGRKKCPSPRALNNSFRSTISFRKKRRVIDHITRCSYCAQEFKLILDLHRYQNSMLSAISDHIPVPSTAKNPTNTLSTSPLIWRWAYLLVGLALIFSSFFFLQQKKELLDAIRTIENKIILLYPTNEHTLSNPLFFRWEERTSANFYILELFDDTLLPIWTSQKISGTQIQYPDKLAPQLHFGKSYFWLISAFSDTEKIAESDLQQFSINKK